MDADSLILFLFFLLCSAYCASAETAYTAVSRVRLRTMVDKGNKKAKKALPQVRALAQSFNEAVLEGLEETELSAFLNVLLRIEENARKLAYETKEDTL